MTDRSDYEVFELGDFALQRGATLRAAKLAYKVYGELDAERSNAIVYPTWYSGRHWDNEWLIGDGMALDPARYFIIVPNMLGNGLSSSPSNTPPPYDAARFPEVTAYDNVAAQHRLVTERFGIERLALVTGWSMGAGQTYQWAVSHPDMVQRACPFCGSSKTSEHNIVFLEGVKAALTADAAWQHGWYERQPSTGLRAMARVYAGWGFSQAFYWNQCYRRMGYSSLEDFLVGFWEGFFLDERDANDLLTMFGRGSTATSAPPRASTATTYARSTRSRPGRSRCRPRRTSTSPRRTRNTPSPTSPTRNCASSPASGATSRVAGSTPSTPNSSTTFSRSSW